MRQCKPEGICQFKSNEVLNSKATFEPLVFDESSLTSKNLEVTGKCGAETAVSVLKLASGLNKYFCRFSLGVFPFKQGGAGAQDGSMAKYELSYHIDGEEHSVPLNLLQFFNVAVDSQTILASHIRAEELMEGRSKLTLEVDLRYGHLQLWVSASNKPCEDNNSILHHELSDYGQSKLLINDPRLDSTAKVALTYNICLKAIGRRSSVGVRLFFDDDRSGLFKEYLMMPPNENIISEIKGPESPVMFAFKTSFTDKNEEYVEVNLNSLQGSGKYIIVCSNGGVPPTLDSAMWKTDSNRLHIDSRSEYFKLEALYIIRIYQTATSAFSSSAANVVSISYTYSNKHTLIKEGYSFKSVVPKTRKALLRIEIPADTSSLLLVKSTAATHFQIHISFKDPLDSSALARDSFHVNLNSIGIKIDQQAIKKNCPGSSACSLFLAVEGEAESKYGLSYVTNNNPFFLEYDSGLNLPMLLSASSEIRLAYRISLEQPDFQFHCENPYFEQSCLVSFCNQTARPYVFPTAASAKLVVSTKKTRFRRISSNTYQQNDLMLVTLKGRDSPASSWLRHENYYMKTVVGVSPLFKHLHSGVSLKDINKRGQWRYYKITHDSDSNILVTLQVNKGACSVVVSRGAQEKPDFEHYLARSAETMRQELTVTPAQLGPGQAIRGEYFVGVYSYMHAVFTLMYRPSDNLYVRLNMNSQVSVDVRADQRQYLEVQNYLGKEDIYFNYQSHNSVPRVYMSMILAKDLENSDVTKLYPTFEKFEYVSAGNTRGGINQLRIEANSPRYCEMCQMIFLIVVDKDDKLDISVRKRNHRSPAFLSDDSTQIGYLPESGHFDEWFFYLSPGQRRFGLDINVLTGGTATLDYSVTFPMSKVGYHRTVKIEGNRYFSIYYTPQRFKNFNFFHKRYLRVTADNNNTQYQITLVENKRQRKINPMQEEKALLGSYFTNYYWFNPVSPRHEFVLNILSVQGETRLTRHGHHLRDFINMVSVSFADDFRGLYNSRYEHSVPKTCHQFGHKVTCTFETPARGIAIIGVENKLWLPMVTALQLLDDSTLELADQQIESLLLDAQAPQRVYRLPLKQDYSRPASLQVDECLNNVLVDYAVVPNGNATKEILWKSLFSQTINVNQFDIHNHLSGPAYFLLRFKKPESVREDQGIDQKKSVASFEFSASESPTRMYAGDSSYPGEVAITNDKLIKIKRVLFDNLPQLLEENNIFINYKLYLTSDRSVLAYLTNCDRFGLNRIKGAKGIADDKSYLTLDLLQYITKESWQKDTEVIKNIDKNNDELTFKPKTISFGEELRGIVVAYVTIFPKTVVSISHRTRTHSRRVGSTV